MLSSCLLFVARVLSVVVYARLMRGHTYVLIIFVMFYISCCLFFMFLFYLSLLRSVLIRYLETCCYDKISRELTLKHVSLFVHWTFLYGNDMCHNTLVFLVPCVTRPYESSYEDARCICIVHYLRCFVKDSARDNWRFPLAG